MRNAHSDLMSQKINFTSLVRENKTLFIILTVGLFLIELQIFAFAATKSGKQSWLQVSDAQGTLIYETSGTRLSDFNKYYFEKTFGPFQDYNTRLVSREVPFPFRAWFVAAVGIPVGAVLLFGFVFRAYVTLIHGETPAAGTQTDHRRTADPESRLEQVLHRIGRLNIFAIGFLVFVIVISYWIIPNTLVYIGKTGLEALIRYKWVFLAIASVFTAIVLWIVYLRYLLAKKAIESQVEIDKYRIQLEYNPSSEVRQLEYSKDDPADAADPDGKNERQPESG